MKTSTLLLITGIYLGIWTFLGCVVDLPWQLIGLTCFGCVSMCIASIHEMFNYN